MSGKISTQQIGDGKLPNKYWVSISSDYGVLKDGAIDWASGSGLIKAEGKTLKVFTSYPNAKNFADEMFLGQVVDGITANTITIEDRISGEIYSKENVLDAAKGEMFHIGNEDLGFTEKKLGKSIRYGVRTRGSKGKGRAESGIGRTM